MVQKTPLYSICVLVGLGFFLGLLFVDLSHDFQVTDTHSTSQIAVQYYTTMILNSKGSQPILLGFIGLFALATIIQLFNCKNKVLLALFLLGNIAAGYLYYDVTNAQMQLLAGKGTQALLLAQIKHDHLMMVGVFISHILTMTMILRKVKELVHKQKQQKSS